MSAKRIKTIRLIQIQAFLAVVDRDSFTEAASELECDQSTVSRYVDELGDWLGAPLLQSGTAKPSAAGNVFLPLAREAVGAIVKGKAEIAALLAARERTIRGKDLRL